jgi:hypothetical protein
VDPVLLLALWSPPRCRSTAFWRMLAERGDLAAFHEPFWQLADQGRVARYSRGH